MVVDKSGKRAFVTNEYPGVVTVIDLEKSSIEKTIPVGPFVRGLACSPDEKTLYVTHYYTGAVSAVELSSGKILDVWKRRARPTTSPDRSPSIRRSRSPSCRTCGRGSLKPTAPVRSFRTWRCSISCRNSRSKSRRHPVAMDQFNDARVTCNPWEVAVHPDGERCYVVYAGTNDLNICNIVDDGQTYLERPSGRSLFNVGKNPRAVACSPDGKLRVRTQRARLRARDLRRRSVSIAATVKLCQPTLSKEIVRGMELFNLADDPMSRLSWISCSSCHPDGDHDGRTWKQPEGMRRTHALFRHEPNRRRCTGRPIATKSRISSTRSAGR